MRSDHYLIGSGAGFSGDRIDAAQPVIAALIAAGGPAALVFETLGERTLALSQIARRNDPSRGYDPYMEQFLAPILAPAIQGGITIVGNFGAANPAAAAARIAEMAARDGLSPRIATVGGDDLIGHPALRQSRRWDGDGGLEEPADDPIAANVYLGARPIADAIKAGAQIIVTGRVADPALVLGPLVAHFGWNWENWDRIAAGTLAGHLIECGSQVTGGYFADPGSKNVPDMARLGFPIVRVSSAGEITLSKPTGTGGRVDLMTVKEQLLYEIHDPSEYLTPDVVLDINGVTLEECIDGSVAIAGARGRPAPATLKATICHAGDWLGEAGISYAGPNARARAELAIDTIRERIALRGLALRSRADILGTVSVFDDDAGTLRARQQGPANGDFRVHFAFSGTEDHVRAAVQEVGALYCCGPAGGGGMRASVQPRIMTHSRLVPRELVMPHYSLLPSEGIPS